MSKKGLLDMMKHIQKSLKRKTKLEVDVKEQSGAKDKSDAKEQSGGNGAYQFLKKYLDMIFSRETELKKEQEDSLERLTKLKEIEKKEAEEEAKENNLEEEQSMLAKEQEAIEIAKKNALIAKGKAEEIHAEVEKTKEEADQKNAEADAIAQQAETELANTENNKKMLEEAIEIRKKSIKNADNIIQTFFKEMENKEMVSLEETHDSREENAAVEEIEQKETSGLLEKKTDDLLI